jgi:hypothetical protein
MSKTLKKIRKKRAKQDRETRERHVSKNSPLFINTKHNIFWLFVFMQQSSHQLNEPSSDYKHWSITEDG